LHIYEWEHLSAEQRRWAEDANLIHLRIQEVLMRIVVSDHAELREQVLDTVLRLLARKMVAADLELWKASDGSARRALTCAAHVHAHLGTSLGPVSLSNVILNAQSVAQALVAMTDLQRKTMLGVPSVLQAFDIAEDCSAEFDNREQWGKWVARAYPGRGSGGGMVFANDNQRDVVVEPRG
jgi:hypothetical protein